MKQSLKELVQVKIVHVINCIILLLILSCSSYKSTLSRDHYHVIDFIIENEIVTLVNSDSIFMEKELKTIGLEFMLENTLSEYFTIYNLTKKDIEYMAKQSQYSGVIDFKKIKNKSVYQYATPSILKKGDTIYQTYKNVLHLGRTDVFELSKPIFNLNHSLCVVGIYQLNGFGRSGIYIKKNNEWRLDRVIGESLD